MQLHLFHSNDIHSHFEHWHSIVEIIRSMKEKYGNNMCYVDLGDHIDRCHPYTEALLGKGNVVMLNEAGVDVVTIGNNEGITLSKQQLIDLYSEANFDVVVSNLYNQDGTLPIFSQPYSIQKIGQYTIGFIGATAEYPLYYEPLGWQITKPIEALTKQVEIVRPQVDILVCLSHLGKDLDDLICKQLPQIDIVLGAHTHHYFEQGKWVNGVLQAAAGRYGNWLGHILIDIDEQQMTLTSQLIDIKSREFLKDKHIKIGERLLHTPIINLPYTISNNLLCPSKLNDLLAQSLMEVSGIPAVIINSGLLLTNLPRGIITQYDILQCLPHPINPAIITLTGAQLIDVLQTIQSAQYRHQQISGMGFRGDNFGDYITLNLSYGSIGYYYQQEKINEHDTYQVVTIDMFTFGRYLPQLAECHIKYLLPNFLRHIFADYLKGLYPN